MKKIKIKVEMSARHLHLSKIDAEKLFGKNYHFIKYKNISQPGQFSTKQLLKVKGPKNVFEKIRIVGPERKKSQFELSITDCFYLGIKPSLHISGDVKKSPLVKVIGPKGNVNIPAIVALRHIHCSDKEAEKYGLKNKQKVKVKIKGKRAVEFNNVIVRVHPEFSWRLHLDTDEANAAGIKQNTIAEVLI